MGYWAAQFGAAGRSTLGFVGGVVNGVGVDVDDGADAE